MKKLFATLTTIAMAVSAYANAESPVAETLKAPAYSPEAPETSLTATKAQFYYYPDYYKDGSSCYQLVMTNCEYGFSDGGKGTLPAGPGQLLCVFLCGPASDDDTDPIVPAGTYTFSDTPSPYTFSSKYSHWVDAFDSETGELTGWQLTLAGGSVSITKENGIYTVNATISAKAGEESEIRCTASYTGEINKPAPLPGLPINESGVYNMNVPNLSGMYDKSQGVFSLSFYGCQLDGNGFIVGRGDLTNVMIIHQGGENLLEALAGTHEFAPYLDYPNCGDGTFLGGYFYAITSDFILPMGTYTAVYNDYGSIESCSLAAGGTITVTPIGDLKDGNMTFDFNLKTEQGATIAGSWTGNIYGKIQGVEPPAGIDEAAADQEPIYSAARRIIAPHEAEVFTLSGTSAGRENLQPGIYLVRHNGNVKKVIVK